MNGERALAQGGLNLWGTLDRGPHRPSVCKIAKLNTESHLRGEGGLNLWADRGLLTARVSRADFFLGAKGLGFQAGNQINQTRDLTAISPCPIPKTRDLFPPPRGVSKVRDLSVPDRRAATQTYPQKFQKTFLAEPGGWSKVRNLSIADRRASRKKPAQLSRGNIFFEVMQTRLGIRV